MFRDQRMAFVLVGGLNTVISYAAFLAFSRLGSVWGGDLAVLEAQAIAVPVAWVLHRRFVFRVTGHLLRDFSRFMLVTVIPIGVNLLVLPVLTTVLYWPVLLAQLLFTVVWVVASFFLHREFSFRRTAADAPAGAGGVPGPADALTDAAARGAVAAVGMVGVVDGSTGRGAAVDAIRPEADAAFRGEG